MNSSTKGVMGNVVMLNFCYDVPVKLFSTHLWLFAVILITPQLTALFDFFILNRKTALTSYHVPALMKKYSLASVAIKSLIVFALVGTMAVGQYQNMFAWGDYAPKAALYGIYKTETFVVNNDTLPPLTTDTLRWKKIIIENTRYALAGTPGTRRAKIIRMDDSFTFHEITVDTTRKVINFSSLPDENAFTYTQLAYTDEKESLTLSGTWNKTDTLTVKLNKVDVSKFTLVNRGFHWVNESPYQR